MANTGREQEVVGYAEMERRYGIKRGTLYSLVSQRRIPHLRLGSRFVRFRVAEVEAWLNSHRVGGDQ